MPDEVRSAYAVLGLQPDASLQDVKQQFKTLVRRWHPDRFTNDPQGKAEANDRLRVINHAYSTILQTRFGEPTQVRRDSTPPLGTPLTREQIDAMIEALSGRRPRKTFRELVRDDPWNRGLSLALVGLYILVDAIQAWRHPWSLAAAGFSITRSGSGSVAASVVGSVMWTLPLVWVIWYADAFSKKVAWLFLAVFAVLLPVFVAMMRL